MICAWKELLAVLPPNLREEVDRLGKEDLQELRLRLNRRTELITAKGNILLESCCREADLNFVINTASKYSPWAASSASDGYITAPGGHRIGICGQVITAEKGMAGVRKPGSLCIRVARDFPGIGARAAKEKGNLLILGVPGSGKTTLLRDIIREKSNSGQGCVAVVDERGELFPMCADDYCFQPGIRTDILTGCGKDTGIQCVLRTMGPKWIAVDEITAEKDCYALQSALWCGVGLMATAHAGSREDLLSRPIYKPIVTSGLFSTLLIMGQDKSWHLERM